MTNLTTIVMPVSLLKRARELGINVSKTSREAVADAVQKIEYDAARKANLAQNDSEAATVEARRGGVQHDRICSAK